MTRLGLLPPPPTQLRPLPPSLSSLSLRIRLVELPTIQPHRQQPYESVPRSNSTRMSTSTMPNCRRLASSTRSWTWVPQHLNVELSLSFQLVSNANKRTTLATLINVGAATLSSFISPLQRFTAPARLCPSNSANVFGRRQANPRPPDSTQRVLPKTTPAAIHCRARVAAANIVYLIASKIGLQLIFKMFWPPAGKPTSLQLKTAHQCRSFDILGVRERRVAARSLDGIDRRPASGMYVQ
ncbi:hypothetical protein R3P38DRAFT_3275475 [Favolaschia claudopus]|uniref:Uncharacterized protein n=1 Tax=Favolaschia claudopus TaxID=2862362 RepID=A0AAW0ATU7_9AGAR